MNDKNIEEKARNEALEYLHGTSNEKEFLEMEDLLPMHDAIKAVDIAIKYQSDTLTQYKEALRELVELTTYLGIDNGTYLEIIKAKQLLTDKE